MALLLTWPGAASAISVDAFLAKATALQRRGILAGAPEAAVLRREMAYLRRR